MWNLQMLTELECNWNSNKRNQKKVKTVKMKLHFKRVTISESQNETLETKQTNKTKVKQYSLLLSKEINMVPVKV